VFLGWGWLGVQDSGFSLGFWGLDFPVSGFGLGVRVSDLGFGFGIQGLDVSVVRHLIFWVGI